MVSEEGKGMSLVVLLNKQKTYFWSMGLFIGLAFGLLVGGISIIAISQIFFLGRVPMQVLMLTLVIVIGAWALVSFVYYKTFYPRLSCSIDVGPGGVIVQNKTSGQLKLILQTAELTRKYKARQGSGYLYTLSSAQKLRTQDMTGGERVVQETHGLHYIKKYEDPLVSKISFYGIEVKGKDGKNIWVAFCGSQSVVFFAPRKEDKQGLILRPVWNHMRKLAEEQNPSEPA